VRTTIHDRVELAVYVEYADRFPTQLHDEPRSRRNVRRSRDDEFSLIPVGSDAAFRRAMGRHVPARRSSATDLVPALTPRIVIGKDLVAKNAKLSQI
jgi:hypothetical protein